MIFYTKNIPDHIQQQPLEIVLAEDIKPATESIKTISDDLINDIWKLIYIGSRHNGMGFSATQAGIQKRLFVIEDNITDPWNPFWIPYINPSFYLLNKDEDILLEGCLSVPGEEILVKRYKNIVAQYHTIVKSYSTGQLSLQHKTERMSGIKSRCYTHEKDHLLAVSILDKRFLPSVNPD